MYLWEILTVKLYCLEGLAILVWKELVFGPGLDLLGGYGDLAYVMLGNTLVLWGWSVINPDVSSGGTSNSTILPQGYRTGPEHDLAGITLDPTSFSVCVKKMGEGWTRRASDIVKAESSGEDPKATGGLVSDLPYPRVNNTKQHTCNTLVLWG